MPELSFLRPLASSAPTRPAADSPRLATIPLATLATVVAVGHLLSTPTFDLFAWTAVCWLPVRMLRTGQDRLWLAVGALCGCALLNKPLIAAFFAALLIALLGFGPRERLRNLWLPGGAVI